MTQTPENTPMVQIPREALERLWKRFKDLAALEEYLATIMCLQGIPYEDDPNRRTSEGMIDSVNALLMVIEEDGMI